MGVGEHDRRKGKAGGLVTTNDPSYEIEVTRS